MTIRSTDDGPAGPGGRVEECAVRIAAAGDIHLGRRADAERWRTAFDALAGRADLVLLAGDLTTHGEPDQGALVAEAVAGLDVPIVAVLGNHDWHVNRAEELVTVLREGGIDVLDREARILELCGAEVGIAGVKGFSGGFDGAHIPDFGEPLMRAVYAESMDEAEALDAGLREIAFCPFRIALLHYAPITATLEGERTDIWPFLGTDRLAVPLREHHPDLVLHGHAHAGTFEGRLGEVPVFNVSVPVLGEDFWVFEMSGAARAPSELH
jgi:Icc-related predicted phosphoesterase